MSKYLLFVGMILLSAVLWSVPSAMRQSDVPFPWYDSYDDAHMVKEWRGSLLDSDSRTGQPRLLNPAHVALAWVGGDTLGYLRVAGVLSGVAGAVGLWLLLRRTSMTLRASLLTMAIFGVSTVGLFAVPTSRGIMVGFTLLAAGLVVQGSLLSRVFAGILVVIVGLSGPIEALHAVLVVAGLLIWQRKFGLALLYSVLCVFGAIVWWPLLAGAQSLFSFSIPVVGILSEFGARPGVGVMVWLISMVGLAVLWQKSKRAAVLLTGATVYASVSVVGAIYAAPLWSALSAFGIMMLFERQWRYPTLQTLSLFAVACGMVFSLIAVSFAIVNAPPTTAIAQGMREVDGRVLTYPPVADWVKWWSDAEVVYDTHASSAKVLDEQASDLGFLWYNRDAKNATVVLDRLGVDDVVVTKAMREGQVWGSDEEGLLFLLDKSEMFKKGFSNGEVEVYHRGLP
jgi:hypothetical protein